MIESKRRKPVVPQGGPETDDQIKAGLRDYSERSRILRENHSALMKEYPDQWVAFGDNWQFVVSDTHEGILEKLRECGAYPPNSVVRRLETNPPRRIPTAGRRRTP